MSGPLRGRTWVLEQDVFVIGRHADCTLQLGQPDVSRRHCEVRREGPHLLLRDLDSSQGTFINEVPVREHRLEHTDVLQVGTHRFLFLCDDAPTRAPEAGPDEARDATWSTIEKRPEDVMYLQPARVRAALAAPAGRDVERIAAALNALLEVSTAVHSLQDAARLSARVLEVLREVLPAQRGAVLCAEPGDEAPTVSASYDARTGDGAPFPISRTLLDRVLRGGAGCLCRDVAAQDELSQAQSLKDASVRALLCVPLPGREHPLGALYFDTLAGPAFDEHHLELLTAAAALVAHGLAQARHLARLESERQRLQQARLAHGLVGQSEAMQRLSRSISRIAPSDATVLLRGESGTGKEVTAHLLHRASARAGGPFVAINCATLSEALLESELFGHEKGAFTGALARKEGKLEVAHTGTLLLDEVGEMAPPLQARLLRVLQERQFERVGGTRPIRVDVRIIAATNRDLEAAMREGRFREDLFYRLNVITLTLPPLRERREDIPLLALHFARLHGERLRGHAPGLSPAALRALTAYDWPGNVRQLGNVIERAVVLGAGEEIQPEDLPDEVLDGGASPASAYQATLLSTRRKTLLDALEKAGGNLHAAAALLGIHVNSLHRLIRNLGLKSQLPRERA